MRIEIQIGDQRFLAALADSAAAATSSSNCRSPEHEDHGGVEKTGRLASKLSLDGQPSGADPDVGDVGYYAPATTSSSTTATSPTTRASSSWATGRRRRERIADVNGAVTATVTRADD